MKSCLVCAAALLCSAFLTLPAHAGVSNPPPELPTATVQQQLVIPEPAMLLLLGAGLSVLAIKFRARRRT